MSYDLIDKNDPRIANILNGMDKMEQLLDSMKNIPQSTFFGDTFLTDEELSKIIKVSRRTLQEYRTLGIIPYYLIQGKALYKESDIKKIIDDAYIKCREELKWV